MIIESFETKETYELGKKMGKQAQKEVSQVRMWILQQLSKHYLSRRGVVALIKITF